MDTIKGAVLADIFTYLLNQEKEETNPSKIYAYSITRILLKQCANEMKESIVSEYNLASEFSIKIISTVTHRIGFVKSKLKKNHAKSKLDGLKSKEIEKLESIMFREKMNYLTWMQRSLRYWVKAPYNERNLENFIYHTKQHDPT